MLQGYKVATPRTATFNDSLLSTTLRDYQYSGALVTCNATAPATYTNAAQLLNK
jgi:hypothetical protein